MTKIKSISNKKPTINASINMYETFFIKKHFILNKMLDKLIII